MTMGDRPLRTRRAWRRTRPRGLPVRLVVALAAVEVLAAGLFIGALISARTTGVDWRNFAVLLGLSVLFEEISRQVSKQRLLINTDPHADMTSVWTFAAALVLPAGTAALLAVTIAVHVWIRAQRVAGKLAYRKGYSAATVVLACLAANAVVVHSGVALSTSSLRVAAVLVLALTVYTGVNRLLISVAVMLSGAPHTVPVLLGRWDDNALELSTLSIGYLLTIVLVNQPWLAGFVLLPMLLLQRGALVRQLEHTATFDTKTKLLNLLAWRPLAERQLALPATSVAAVLVIDLDDFKAVNDVHGHLIGDAALFHVGKALLHEVRTGDLVGRFGGEEFVVMLPDLAVDAAFVIAERLRLRIASIRLAALDARHGDTSDCGHVLAASVGVAVYPDHAGELSGLIEAADRALYVAKRAGRNRVAVADDRVTVFPDQPAVAVRGDAIVPLAG
jgi:diguanylate cyclase (GGDEF)-like protein